MPIRPDQRSRYPENWRDISRRVRAAAGDRCEICGVADRAWGWRDQRRRFHPVDRALYPGLTPPFYAQPEDTFLVVRILQIVLTVAHLDHQPENNARENLRALCQLHHLQHDRPHHRTVRIARTRAAMRTAELPLEQAA